MLKYEWLEFLPLVHEFPGSILTCGKLGYCPVKKRSLNPIGNIYSPDGAFRFALEKVGQHLPFTHIDDCAQDPCLNGGTCQDGINEYQCRCSAGYTGTVCEIDIDECVEDPCLNGGTCLDRINEYQCICDAGYTGTNCEMNIDECSAEPCQNGGTCEDGVNEYTCQCVPGYTGTHCEQDINECMSRPCLNGGKCVDELNQYSCVCQRGWTGSNCQSITCEENEFLCDDGVGCVLESYRCDYIPDCNDNSDESGCDCIPSIQFQCLSGGCVHNSWLCDDFEDCFDGSDESNDTCDSIDNIDECASEPCWNGASCQDSINTFVCLCPQGFTGALCEQNINDCTQDPCLNGGTCEDGVNEYQCRCSAGYSGPNCDVHEVQVCPPDPELIIARDTKVNLTSYGYPNNYMNNMRCFWTVRCQEGGRILVQFIDFYVERGYDNLYIGTAQNGRLLGYTGNSLPDLDVLSPADGSALYFEFYTDGSVTTRGFHICLTNINAEDLMVCPGNQLEVIDESMFCDGFYDCQDRSDEDILANNCSVCGIEPNITLPDNGMVFNLTSRNYPSNYITSDDTNIICQWFVTTSAGPGEFQGSGARSSIYIHFVDFYLDTNDAYLYFGRNEANWREVALTGSSLPRDMISPNGTDMIVITFQVSRYAYPRRGFYMELSEYTDEIEHELCDNEWQILESEDLICDGVYQCIDMSDEQQDCYYCGIEPNITLADNGMVFNLTSRNYPSNYITTSGNDITCQWFVTTSAGSRELQGSGARSSIYIHFVDFYLDTNDAYLYFGRDEANWREVALTGSSLPRDMISPNGTDMIVITFQVSRYAYPRRGFYMELSEYTDEIEHVLCDNEWEILESEDLICDGVYQCIDRSDEQLDCYYCGIEPNITLPDNGMVFNLTSRNYPSNYITTYGNDIICQWFVTTSAGSRELQGSGARSSIYIHFVDFYLDTNDAYLYFGRDEANWREVALTGSSLPRDMISPNGTDMIVITFQVSRYAYPRRGFYMELSEYTDEIEHVLCDNEWEILESEDLICDGVYQCIDRSDEQLDCYYCGIEPNITLPDNGMVFNLTSRNYPSNYITSYGNDIICQWFVTTSAVTRESQGSGARSSIYIHFVDFYLDTNDAYLYFGRDEANWREVALTGSSLPLDMISPNGTDMIVITFVVERYASPRRGFSMQLSENTDEIDHLFCDNEWQILGNEALRCDGINQCSDRSDEPLDCVCPEPEIIIPIDTKVNVMSYSYPNNYMNNMRCFWTVRCQEGGRILVQFIDFYTERGYDNLYIGTAQNGRLLEYTGNSLPDLDVLSPADGSALHFEFYTDGSITSRGFHICLTNINAEDLVVCPGNQLEVIDESMFCDGFNDCQDRSDEGILANCSLPLCDPDEFQCFDGSCIPRYMECDLRRNCHFGEDEMNCDFCGIEPNINLADNGTVFNLTSLNYPSNYLTSYDSDIICQWFVTTSAGSREFQGSGARSSIYIHFVDFYLDTNDAYLYFGRDEANWREVALTGSSLPRDMISPNGTDMIVITFEVRRYAYPRRGFYMQLSEYTDEIDYVFCDNDWQILGSEDLICDGIYQCSDRSDEPRECYYCGIEPNITLPDSGMVFNLTSRNYPSNYITTSGNDITCQWFVTTSSVTRESQGSGARSSIYIHFVDFSLDTYDAYLYFGRDEANWREVALTGSILPRDMISPNGTDMIVITFEVSRYAYPRRGFFMELSEYTDEVDYVFCDNEWEILDTEDLICDGIYQCSDRSDEPEECYYCGIEPNITLPDNGIVFNLTSRNYPSNYITTYGNEITCQWFVTTSAGSREFQGLELEAASTSTLWISTWIHMMPTYILDVMRQIGEKWH
ncbi:CUB and sushi domain-containing protein 3-like [Amphiura filiformis]|uniref:CUB and sushi domain-containing protein 3-like n=1 Tax=Amphiura filiformis TaxID=82378 RepID=UPI003B214967